LAAELEAIWHFHQLALRDLSDPDRMINLLEQHFSRFEWCISLS
jgi:hypothetical protein